jgi:hypothetical protein
MKVGDLVKLCSTGFDEAFRNATMLVIEVQKKIITADGTEIGIAPVVQVVSPIGLRRFNVKDVEVISENR